MYIPKRKPSAHQVAAAQGSFKGCHVYLESGTDVRFWRYFIDENNVMLHACGGWLNVVETIEREAGKGIICLGIIDKDFRELTPNTDPLPNNIFTTDDHDIEMMMLKTKAATRVITHFDASGKIEAFEQVDGDLMEFVYGITDSIGLLKLVNFRYDLKMTFKKDIGNQQFELPSYEDFLDNTCHFISDEKMISYLCSWSINHQKRPNRSEAEIKALVIKEKAANYDTMQLSCGHDVCYVLAHILWKRIVNKRKIKQDVVEELLSVSYAIDDLRRTELYKDIEGWSQGSGIRILKF